MKEKRYIDDNGFSLIEILVALAIMGVMSGLLIVSMGIIPRTDAKACANGLKTAIGQTKILTMGKKQTTFELKHDSTDGKYYTVEITDDGMGNVTTSDPELCGKRNVVVSYHIESTGVEPADDEGSFIPLNKGDSLTLSFDRGSGKEIQGGSPGASTLCDAIMVQGGGATYMIRIYTATGKLVLQ